MIPAFPVTMITAIVSPTALPIPRMIAAVIPGSAAGSRTRAIVCQWVAPSAREPSFRNLGMELNASSETLMIVGRAMMPRRIDPARTDSPLGTCAQS